MAKFKDGVKISGNVFRYLIRNQTGRVPNGPIPGSFKPTSGRNRGGRPYYGTVDYPRQLEFSERRKFDLEETQINVVYVLHFLKPLMRPKNNTCACHYVGSTTLDRLWDRLQEHRSGSGAKITSAEMIQGGELILVAYIEISKQQAKRNKFEKLIKARKNTARHCPLCRANILRRERDRRRGKPSPATQRKPPAPPVSITDAGAAYVM